MYIHTIHTYIIIFATNVYTETKSTHFYKKVKKKKIKPKKDTIKNFLYHRANTAQSLFEPSKIIVNIHHVKPMYYI